MYERFEPARGKAILDKLEIIHTPKHGSWLNMAEIELSVLSCQCIDQRFASKDDLITQTALWQTQSNALQATIDWQFTTEAPLHCLSKFLVSPLLEPLVVFRVRTYAG